MATTKILIAEDHALLREGLRSLIEANGDYEVVGEARDGREALRSAQKLNPDIVLMDLCMPNVNGMEAIKAIKLRMPEIKIIAVTAHRSDEHVRVSLEAGANGYVLKDDTHQDLLKAIDAALNGKVFLSPGIANRIVTGFLGQGDDDRPTKSWSALTTREREVIKLIAEGRKNREIAEYLSISIKTVEKHRANLMKKLGLHNASELTTYALENGLVRSG